MKRRLLSLLLALCMVVSLLPATALATDDTSPPEVAGEILLPSDDTREPDASARGSEDSVSDAAQDLDDGDVSGDGEDVPSEGDPSFPDTDGSDGIEDPAGEDAKADSDIDDTAVGEEAWSISPEESSDALGEGREESVSEEYPATDGETQIVSFADLSNTPVSLAMLYASEDTDVIRYTVLVLDCSGSMSGTPMARMKVAAQRFCEQVLRANGTNYVAIVPFATNPQTVTSFTDDEAVLDSAINRLSATGGTNINGALLRADELLNEVTAANDASVVKNIVLLSDGLPEDGTRTSTGRYTSSDSSYYQYANACYDTASSMWSRYSIYTLGFFHSLSGRNLEFGRRLMRDLQNAGYYEVNDPNDLEFVFGEIAGDVTNPEDVLPRTFRFRGVLVEDRDVEQTCYYSDSYFMEDARAYNASLATMSLCFELSTWSSYESTNWTTKAFAVNPTFRNARDLLIGEFDSELVRDEDDELVYECDVETGMPKIKSGTGLGFQDFDVQDFWGDEPTKDSIGVLAANKVVTLEDGSSFTLVALGVRGGGYGQEWASNFTVGKTGDHDGFATARDNVLTYLKNYVNKYQITGAIKLWIVGYSRAGATANMVAGELDDGYVIPGVTIAPEDLFVYTFEAPQGENRSASTQEALSKSGIYDNIHNTVNLADIVPMVAPSVWNFWRNTGKEGDNILPSPIKAGYSSMRETMLDIFDDFEGDTTYKIRDYVSLYRFKVHPTKILPGGDPFIEVEEYESSTLTGLALADGTTFLFGVVGDREDYYYDLQDGVREIFALLNGGSLTDLASEDISLDEFFERFFEQLTFERFYEIIKPMLSINPFYSFDARKAQVEKNLDRFVKDVLGDSDLWGTIRFAANLPSTLKGLLWNLISTILDDVWNNGINATSVRSIYNLVVMVAQGGLGQAHYPEVALAWMMSMDKNYTGSSTGTTGSVNGTRIVHINCPVDVSVYKGTQLVASIVDDARVDIDGSYIPAYINGDGEKIIILPADESYTVFLTATDSGEVYYSVNEYSYDMAQYVRVINYAPVQVESGDTLTGFVPAFSSEELNSGIPTGSGAAYSLTDTNGSTVNSSVGDPSAKYTVSVSAGDYGYVTGGGVYMDGNFAEVVAYPMAGGSFTGWYDGEDNFVSAEEEYRFPVYADTELTAKFSEVVTYQLTVTAQTGGSVENETTISVPAGVEVSVKADANEGYTFAGWTANIGTFEDQSAESTWFAMPANDVTVVAHFNRDTSSVPPTWGFTSSGGGSSSNPSYQIIVSATSNGTVTVTPTSAKSGTKVTITATPNDGYATGSVTATNSSGRSISITDNSDGTYTFTMPASKVTVTATFVRSTYNVAIDGEIANGTVWSDKKTAQEGEAVTLTVTPDEGFELEMLVITSDEGENVNLIKNEDGTCTFTMPTSNVTITATFAAIEIPWVNPFTDVAESDWFYDDVAYVAQHGLMNGVGDQKFDPKGTTTRGMIMTILARMAGVDTSGGTGRLWYQPGMEWAMKAGVSDGTDPEGEITREQFATMLWRYAGEPAVTGNLSDFPDADDVHAEWAGSAMVWAVQNDIIKGSDGRLNPRDNATRAEVAAMLTRFCKYIEK